MTAEHSNRMTFRQCRHIGWRTRLVQQHSQVMERNKKTKLLPVILIVTLSNSFEMRAVYVPKTIVWDSFYFYSLLNVASYSCRVLFYIGWHFWPSFLIQQRLVHVAANCCCCCTSVCGNWCILNCSYYFHLTLGAFKQRLEMSYNKK